MPAELGRRASRQFPGLSSSRAGSCAKSGALEQASGAPLRLVRPMCRPPSAAARRRRLDSAVTIVVHFPVHDGSRLFYALTQLAAGTHGYQAHKPWDQPLTAQLSRHRDHHLCPIRRACSRSRARRKCCSSYEDVRLRSYVSQTRIEPAWSVNYEVKRTVFSDRSAAHRVLFDHILDVGHYKESHLRSADGAVMARVSLAPDHRSSARVQNVGEHDKGGRGAGGVAAAAARCQPRQSERRG